MSQSEKSFTVSDRRHFTPEGRPREDPPEAEEPQGQAAPQAEDPPGSGADQPVEFAQFILGLASEAGRLMAGEGAPVRRVTFVLSLRARRYRALARR